MDYVSRAPLVRSGISLYHVIHMSTVVSIPVIFVTGLLGSGKSTTVASLLDSRKHGSVAVAVQELAQSNIDTGLLQGGETLNATSQFWIEPIRDNVYDALQSLLSRANFDAVIIETSGAIPLTRVLAESKIHTLPNLRYAGSITILDAQRMSSITYPHEVPEMLQENLRNSDLVLLNKLDRVPIMQRSGLQAHTRRMIHDCCDTIPLRATRYGRVSLNELLQSLPPVPRALPAKVESGVNLELKHCVFQDTRPFRSADIYNWLQKLAENPPPGLLRAKGFFYVDSLSDYILVFDVVHHHIEIGIEGVWWASIPADLHPDDLALNQSITAGSQYGDRRQELVFIGKDLDTHAIHTELSGLLTDSLDATAANDPMHHALRKQLAQLASKKKRRR